MKPDFYLLRDGKPYHITMRIAVEFNRVDPAKIIAHAMNGYQAVQLWELYRIEAIPLRNVNTEIGLVKCLSYKDLEH